MRKTATALLALGLVAMFATSASATPYFTDTFTYPEGTVIGSPAGGALNVVNSLTGWQTHSGSATFIGVTDEDITVHSGMAIVNLNKSPDDSRSLGATTGATDKTYACFKMYVVDPAPLAAGITSYFAHFKDTPTGTLTFTSKLWVGPNPDVTKFNLGVSNNLSTGVVNWATPLSYATWYTVAMRFDAATGMATMWVNPADEGSTSVAAGDVALIGRTFGAFGLRQVGGQNFKIQMDDLSVGHTFAETCSGLPTPTTQSTWGHVKTMYR